MNRIGLLGGTFDPPHIGHLWLAETAREQLQLEQVLFLPAGQPPHKQNFSVTAVSHRLKMTQHAIASHPAFCLDTRDIHRAPPHTTVTLLPLLQSTYPKAKLWLLIGSDSLRDLPDWSQPEKVIHLCRLAVLPRPDFSVDWEALKTAVPGIETAVDMLVGPTVAISSTEIRRWAGKGRSLRYLTETAVVNYINEHHLYDYSPSSVS